MNLANRDKKEGIRRVERARRLRQEEKKGENQETVELIDVKLETSDRIRRNEGKI